MSEFEEAFKIKAQELLRVLEERKPQPPLLDKIRSLYDRAKTAYKAGEFEQALVLVVQAIRAARL